MNQQFIYSVEIQEKNDDTIEYYLFSTSELAVFFADNFKPDRNCIMFVEVFECSVDTLPKTKTLFHSRKVVELAYPSLP